MTIGRIDLSARLRAKEHPAAQTPVVNAALLRSLKEGPVDRINDCLVSFFGSANILLRLPVQARQELLELMAQRMGREPAMPLAEVLGPEDPAMNEFAARNHLVFFSLETGALPEAQNVVPLFGRGAAGAGGVPGKKTVFISKNGQRLLHMQEELGGQEPYALSFMVRGQRIGIDVGGDLQKIMVDMAFPPSDEYLDVMFKFRVLPLLAVLASRFLDGSANGKKYVSLLLKVFLLGYLDPYSTDPFFNQIARRFLMFKEIIPNPEVQETLVLEILGDAEVGEALKEAPPDAKSGLSQIFTFPRAKAIIGIVSPEGPIEAKSLVA
jgi:hypothetical protein